MVKCTYLYDVLEYRKYIIDIEKSKKTMISSHEKIKFKCPNCDNVKEMMVTSFVNRGLSCQICSTGTSYPELFFLAVNKHFDLGFKYQEVYEYGRFDFINYDTKTIVEMNGLAHYEEVKLMNHKATVESDNKKRKWAKENNYTLIFIDARKSEFEFIKYNINKEELLPDIEKSDSVKILSIIKENKKYDVKNMVRLYEDGESAQKIGERYDLDRTTITSILKKAGVKLRKGGQYQRYDISNQDKHDCVVSLAKDGLTVKEISEEVSVSKNVIYKILKNNNIKANKRSKKYFEPPFTKFNIGK